MTATTIRGRLAGWLDVVLKNIVYDFYSKDLSVKVKTAKRAKMRKGEAGGGHIPFGYVRSAADGKKYEVDSEAARVVRRIFGLAWEKAQGCFRKVNYMAPAGRRDFPLRSVCKCGYCGRALQYYPRKKGDYFVCQASRQAVDAPCRKEKVMAAPINAAVLESIKGMVRCGRRFGEGLEKKKGDAGAKAEDRLKEIAGLQGAVRKCQADLFQNSERLMDGTVDRKTYQVSRERINAEKDRLKQRIGVLEAELNRVWAEQEPETERFLDAVKKYDGIGELDNGMVLAFVERVLVYDEGRVEIRWRFSDGLMEEVVGE